MNHTKICPVCGIEFGSDLKPSHLKKKTYCTFECYLKSTRSTRNCLICGKEFTVPKSLPNKYCSIKCASAALVRPDTFKVYKCQVCGNSFEGVASKHRKYCSMACAGLATKKRLTKPDTYVTLTCEHCGKQYIQARRKILRSHFCSVECRNNAPSKMVGVKHPRWKGGVKIYRGSNWASQKKKVLIRDNRTCQICGMKSTHRHEIYIDVHHIVAFRLFDGNYKAANDISNLITLCRSCHNKVDKHGLPCPKPLI